MFVYSLLSHEFYKVFEHVIRLREEVNEDGANKYYSWDIVEFRSGVDGSILSNKKKKKIHCEYCDGSKHIYVYVFACVCVHTFSYCSFM